MKRVAMVVLVVGALVLGVVGSAFAEYGTINPFGTMHSYSISR